MNLRPIVSSVVSCRDPLGGMGVTAQGFAKLTSLLMKIQPRVAMLLEGGYAPPIVAECGQYSQARDLSFSLRSSFSRLITELSCSLYLVLGTACVRALTGDTAVVSPTPSVQLL